jgi:hypothetical protein
MRAILSTISFAAFLAGGCGCSSKPATTTPDTTAKVDGAHNEEEHSAMEEEALTPELKNFHDEFAPIWHSDAPDRQATACGATGDMLELGARVQDAGAPDGAAADWNDRVATFMLAIDHMKEGCQASSPDFDANFSAVHEGFHALMEALPKG